ncbi:MAG: thermonuclease family protein [Archangium sp.]|nr:thermonuclease family protein [Archangium sp.]
MITRLLCLICLLFAIPSLADIAPPEGKRRGSRVKKPPKEKHDALGFIVINGTRTEVRWTDGDSFKFKDGVYKGIGTRLVGYNTLEAYGPVHQWGEWTGAELFTLAKASSQVAAAQEWECTSDGKVDGYKRLLVRCPKLAVEMARAGHGLAYAVDGEKPDPAVVAAQAEAMKEKRGMWAKGGTNGVITSLHSVGEDGDEEQTEAYNRVVDTRTGQALKRKHGDRYESCQNVCLETDGQKSCMIYVPFRHRYQGQPDCLKVP